MNSVLNIKRLLYLSGKEAGTDAGQKAGQDAGKKAGEAAGEEAGKAAGLKAAADALGIPLADLLARKSKWYSILLLVRNLLCKHGISMH